MSANRETLRALAKEISDTVAGFEPLSEGMDEQEFIRARLRQNEALAEVLRKQHRHLRYMAGEKIEPETHYAEAVLIGFGGFES